eukprot:6615030-Pyramimonas_sp.AAC.1
MRAVGPQRCSGGPQELAVEAQKVPRTAGMEPECGPKASREGFELRFGSRLEAPLRLEVGRWRS